MRWATREHCHVDRTACAWLIRRFIDSEAVFCFVADPADVPPDAIPFDMPRAELSHHGDRCSFETMLARYRLDDPVLHEIAAMVHQADLADDRFDAPAAAGLDVLIRGLSLICTDEETLAHTHRLFDGMYEYCRREVLGGRPPS